MSHARTDRPTPDFLPHVACVEALRQEGSVPSPLDGVLLLVLCAVISGAGGWTSIALYGEKQRECRRRFLPVKDGTPSHDPVGHSVCSAGYGGGPTRLQSLDRQRA